MSKLKNNLLTVNDLKMSFGGLLAVDDVNLEIEKTQIFAIIGPNGAGKTTVFNCISGFYKPTSGKIEIENKNITGLKSHQIAQLGIVRTFQNIRLFKKMTVLENLLVAQHKNLQTLIFSGLFNLAKFKNQEQQAIENAIFWLNYMEINKFANRESGTLAYGHQRRLEIARCMITEPKLLMLDEPAAGLNPQEKKELQELIKQLRDEFKITVLLIEHDMSLIMKVSDKISVMDQGRQIALGFPEEIQNNEQVVKAYLGES